MIYNITLINWKVELKWQLISKVWISDFKKYAYLHYNFRCLSYTIYIILK